MTNQRKGKGLLRFMKKIIKNIIIPLFLFAMVFCGMAQTNGNKSDVHQYNYNPEETNDWKLYGYKLGLDRGIMTEEYVFVDIVEYNNLTNKGVEDLVNYGYLHDYIPALIEAGRLPEGFTPSSSDQGIDLPEQDDTINSDDKQPAEDTPPQGTENIPQDTHPSETPSAPEKENTPSSEQDVSKDNIQETQSENKTDSNTSGNPSVVCDESVTGTYVVIKKDANGFSSCLNTNEVISVFSIGQELQVKGLTSNGFYKVVFSDKEQYVKKENLVDKNTYDMAWKEAAKTESTCQSEGSIIYTNEITEETNLVITNKSDHKMKTSERQSPSCEEDGKEILTCEVCGETETKTLSAVGHVKGSPQIKESAGLFHEGVQETKCTVCDKVIETEPIPQIIPNYIILVFIALVGGICVFFYSKTNGFI